MIYSRYSHKHELETLMKAHNANINKINNGDNLQKVKVKVIPKNYFDEDKQTLSVIRKKNYQLATNEKVPHSALGSMLLYDFDYFAPMVPTHIVHSASLYDMITVYVRNDLFKYPHLLNLIKWKFISEPAVEFLYRHDKDLLNRGLPISLNRIPVYVWADMAYRYDVWRELLLESLGKYFNKTSMRQIFYNAPFLLPLVEKKHILHSPLNIKEWVLMANHMAKHGVKFNKETEEYLTYELSITVLKGKTTTSVYTRKAIRSFNADE